MRHCERFPVLGELNTADGRGQLDLVDLVPGFAVPEANSLVVAAADQEVVRVAGKKDLLDGCKKIEKKMT